MNTITRNAIKDSIKQNFTSYPEDYPTIKGKPTIDAIGQLVRWVENEHENEESEDKGSIEDWFTAATDAYLSFFNLLEDYDNWDRVAEAISRIRAKNDKQQIGAVIAKLRKRVGLHQSELADKVGTSQEQISRIERGLVSPSFETVIKIANELNCRTDDLHNK